MLTPTQEHFAALILERLALGESLRGICRDLREKAPGVAPAVPTFLDWCSANPPLAERYARAREEGLGFLFDEIEVIAEESKKAETKEEAAGFRNLIDARKWRLSKMDRRYSDRVELTGAAGSPLVPQAAVAVNVLTMDPIAASKAYQDLMKGTPDAGG